MSEVGIKDLESTITALTEARKDYDLAKTIASEKNKVVEELEFKLLEMLETVGKEVYVGESARVTVVSKLQVTTPKSPEDKQKFFEWLKRKHGEEAMWAYATVNHNSLNSLYNKEVEDAVNRGTLTDIEGIEAPTLRKTLQVRAGK